MLTRLCWTALSLLFGVSHHADVTVGGARPAVVQVSSGYDPAVPIPLVVLLHGHGGDAPGQEAYWRLAPLAERLVISDSSPDETIVSRFGDGCPETGAAIDISDAVTIFSFLFLGTEPELQPPGPTTCGRDPTPDELGCASTTNCP